MVDGIGFKESVQIEKQKWSRMNGKQRWDYFKTYYMVTTLVIIAVIVAVISFIHSYIRNGRDVVEGIYFLNVVADDSFYEKVEDGYYNYIGANDKDQMTDVTTEKYMELTETGYDNTAYSTDMQIVAMVTAGSLDCMFLDDTTLERYANYGAYADLTQVLTDEEYEELKDYIVDVTDEEGNTIPGAICLTGTDLAEKYNICSMYGENAYMVILTNGKNYDTASTFIDYVFNQE